MKNLIKGLVDNGHKIVFKPDLNEGWYVVEIDDGEFEFIIDVWEETEEVLLDYIINEADL